MQRCKLLKFLPLLILAAGASCTRDPKVQAQQAVGTGKQVFRKEQVSRSGDHVRRALQKDMRFGEGYYRLALTEIKLGNYGEALKWLRRAVELQPTNTDAITKLADLYMQAAMTLPAQRTLLLGEVKDLADKLMQAESGFVRRPPAEGAGGAGEQGCAGRDCGVRESQQGESGSGCSWCWCILRRWFTTISFRTRRNWRRSLSTRTRRIARMYDLLYVQYARRNNVAAAEALLKLKVANNPTQAKYLVQLAGHYFFTGKRPEMEAAIQQLRDEKKFPEGHLMAGDFYYFRLRDTGQRQGAV